MKTISKTKTFPEKSSAKKVSEHISCGYSMSNIYAFDDINNKHDGCRSKDCIKAFCESLKELAMEINDFEKK